MVFVASAFFRSLIFSLNGKHEKEGPWEEVFFIVFADSEQSAVLNAETIAKAKVPASYVTEEGEVRWEFVQIERVSALETASLIDQMEIFSRYLKPSEARSILEQF